MEDLRDSGIDIIGDVSWGTHIGQLYSSKNDFVKVAARFIGSGLKNNELCIWVYSQNMDYDEVKSILQTSVKDIDSYIKNNQLKLLPYTQWYVVENSFNELRVNQQWLDLVEYSVSNGFDGLRAVGDTAWLETCYYREFEHYEHNITKMVSELRFIALCLYDINRVSIPEVADIMHNHSFTIIPDGEGFKVVKSIELMIKERQLEENRRKLNELLEYDKLRTEFISNISHELRTPLNVILSTLQMMKQLYSSIKPRPEDNGRYAKIGKYFDTIKQNCYRQIRLVNNLIDITKIDSNFYELHPQTCNIVELVENITMSVAEYMKNRGLTLVFDTNAEEYYIKCDPDQIERIILNLLSNAIKYTNVGGNVSVNVNAHREKVDIIVRDTGEGIPQDKLEYIFDRFRQVDMSLARKREGSGIGLSLVNSLVKKHNGNISVNSEIGKGTEFIIELPCTIMQDSAPDLLKQKCDDWQSRIERISIEFSDIYF